jgi:hypothetical protein
MVLQFTPHTIPLTLAALLALIGGGNAWRRRKGAVEVWGTIVQLMLTAWALVMLLTVTVTGRTPKLVSVSLVVPVVVLTSLSFFVFTVHFTGRSEWLTHTRLALLFAGPSWWRPTVPTTWCSGM